MIRIGRHAVSYHFRIYLGTSFQSVFKLFKDELPVSRESQWIVKDILVSEATKNYVLRSKTGMASKIGWWVGWVETDDDVYFFACNIDLRQERNIGDRINVSRKILAAENILL